MYFLVVKLNYLDFENTAKKSSFGGQYSLIQVVICYLQHQICDTIFQII